MCGIFGFTGGGGPLNPPPESVSDRSMQLVILFLYSNACCTLKFKSYNAFTNANTRRD